MFVNHRCCDDAHSKVELVCLNFRIVKMKFHYVLFVCGMSLVALTIGIGSKMSIAEENELAPLIKKLCTGGSACPDGDSTTNPCEYNGRNCKTSEGCLCGATGATTGKLCDCYK